ncbi:hypothetical protein ACJIZ3_015413 [Penstemon smallii]|uniref:Uncharacterized protein n=1 Tax=Penstemon smallii TaxID=265156 RepID=A0ABD3RMF1_9LAMI
MDPDSVKSTLSNLALGNVMAAACWPAQEKAQASSSVNQKVDLDDLMDAEADFLGEVTGSEKLFVTFSIESSTVARSKCMEKMGAGNWGQDQ